MTAILDQWGKPIQKELLSRDVGGPTVGGVRQPVSGYPGDGLDPRRLAQILRAADQGDPLRYFELAEQIEERDLHYAGVLQTRKRSVSQLDVTVEAASDSAEDVKKADMVREWLKRDELADEMFDILDAIGKGVSFTEIIWDTSEGQFWPQRLEWRDPRWFKPTRDGGSWLLRGGIDGNGSDEELPAFKFIRLAIKAKSGLAVRSGIARLATWAWLFKAYTQRDWAIFTQTYGQPVRLGKYHAGASQDDKRTLFRAVANIAGDCAAIIPEGMSIDFVETDNLGAGSDLYEKRSDWLDRQVSKAVLGQTTTTDAVSGGHAVSQEHRLVQEDIETADCKSSSAVINRDLVRPWCDLEFGAPSSRAKAAYPRVTIARPKKEDLQQLTTSLSTLVPLGLRVGASEIRDKFGLSEPDAGEEILQARTQPAPIAVSEETALQFRQQARLHPAQQVATRLSDLSAPVVEQMVGSIEAMLEQASDLGEFRTMLAEAYPDIDAGQLGAAIGSGLAAIRAAGIGDAEEESERG